MKKSLACAGLLALLPAQILAAPTVYTYTGQVFTDLQDAPDLLGTFTLGMRLTGSLTLTDAVRPNAFINTTGADPRLLSFRFDDGRTEFDIADTVYRLFLATDATGAISNWEIGALKANPVPGVAQGDFLSDGRCGSVRCDIAELYAPRPGGGLAIDFGRNFVPGAWTVAAVPEPSLYVLFAAGIALVGLVGKRRISLPH